MGETILDVIQSRVNEDARIVPSAGFDTDRLVNKRMLREILVSDGDGFGFGWVSREKRKELSALTVFTQQSNKRTIGAPHNILNGWCRDLRDRLLLLNVVQNDGSCRTED